MTKLRCVDNFSNGLSLTIGKIYEGERILDNSWYVTNDKGVKIHYHGPWFQIIHEQAEVVIAHPYTVLTWTKDRGFQPCGAVFKTAEAVFDYVFGPESPSMAYIHTPSGCLYTPNAIITLGLNLWKEVNKE